MVQIAGHLLILAVVSHTATWPSHNDPTFGPYTPRSTSISDRKAAGRVASRARIGPGLHGTVLSTIRQSPGAAWELIKSATWL